MAYQPVKTQFRKAGGARAGKHVDSSKQKLSRSSGARATPFYVSPDSNTIYLLLVCLLKQAHLLLPRVCWAPCRRRGSVQSDIPSRVAAYSSRHEASFLPHPPLPTQMHPSVLPIADIFFCTCSFKSSESSGFSHLYSTSIRQREG